MSIASDEQEVGDTDFREWSASEDLLPIRPEVIRFSKGFLRSKPEVWFPGFAAYWLPLFHTFDIHQESIETTPLLDLSAVKGITFYGSLDGEMFSLIVSEALFDFIARVELPAASQTAKHLFIEYFARRFMTSLASSWSAQEGAVFQFHSDLGSPPVHCSAGVRLNFRLNGEMLSLVIGMSQGLLEKMDQLWITQMLRGVVHSRDSAGIRIVFGNTMLVPSEVGEVLSSGQMLPMNSGGSEEVLLLLDDTPWLEGKLWRHEGGIAFETIREVKEGVATEEGMTPVTFELGEIELSGRDIHLLAQPGAIHEFPQIADQPKMHIYVASKKVGEGRLLAYESQLFVKLLSAS
ncbi:MAG: hypothetical protein ACO3XO_00195 [Bdellovibrionota bacterium]|jgi:hypothetical protein